MTRAGDLVVVSRRVDRLLPDRIHEYLAQHLAGVPVHGGGVSRQTRNGETVSLFGRIHENIEIGTMPSLSLYRRPRWPRPGYRRFVRGHARSGRAAAP